MGNSTSKKPVRGRAPKDNGRKIKKKANVLASEKIDYVDYKDINLLQRFMSDRSKIRGQRLNGATVQQQREVANAIKNAREMALLPYTKRVASVGRGPRGPRGPRGSEGAVDQVEEQNIDAVIENLETGIEFEAADEIETNEEG
ncbi:MAG: ribosomal protein [Actinomycetota bacterium]|jgi:small subunit ribosomal protein S18